ncbi:MAG: M61 family metallopeptidase [Terriglobales bacterium]
MKPLAWFCLLATVLALPAAAQPPQALAIGYDLDLTHPANHLLGVTLHLAPTGRGSLPETLQLAMPAWYPGRYSIYNYAVNVQNLAAGCASEAGSSLPLTRLGPSSWQLETRGCGAVAVRYRVFGNTLTGSFAQLDRTHANVNGGPVFLYVEGHKADPVALHIQAPAGWKVLDELGDLNQTTLRFPNYDVFIDAPIEAAPDFTLETFREDGKSYRVLIHSYQSEGNNHAALLAGLRRIVAVENAVIGPPYDLKTYTFFFHFDPQSRGDGMEHLFGTQIMIPEALGSDSGLDAALDDAAHEFFHQWNVKRIRPLALGPWNYQQPDPTRCLWIAEGLTQYYGDISIERAGLISADAYLSELGGSFGRFEEEPGHALMSAADSSLTAWFHDRTPLWQETNQRATTISYYQKGELLGAMLDLDLRRRSGGRQSLDTVMRYMWKHFYQGLRATYYLPGRGYRQEDFERALEAVSGASYRDFFARYVNGTADLPFNDYLDAAGLRIACTPPPATLSYSGLELSGARVAMVAPDSPGERAGLGVDDEIKTIDGQPVAAADAPAALRALPPERPASLTVTAHFQTVTLTLVPAAPHAARCEIVPNLAASPAQLQLRRQWLGAP